VSTYLGEFEQLILLAVLRLGKSATAAAIRTTVEDASGRKTWIGAVYTTLDRLDAKNLVESSISDVEDTGGRRRKVFALTAEGQRSINEAYATWQRATKGLKFRRA
jgi:DNA-binding PadR family transcriptional regulator